MSFVERNQPIQALTPYRPDQSFAERVGLPRPHGRLQRLEPDRLDGAVDRRRSGLSLCADASRLGPDHATKLEELSGAKNTRKG